MSLFPAYSGGDAPKPSTSEDKIWLSNDSFNAGPSIDKKKQIGEMIKYSKEQKKKSKVKKMKHGASEEDKVSWRNRKNVYSSRRKKLCREREEHKKFCEKNPVIENISDECDLYCIDKTRRTDFLICSTLSFPIKPSFINVVVHKNMRAAAVGKTGNPGLIQVLVVDMMMEAEKSQEVVTVVIGGLHMEKKIIQATCLCVRLLSPFETGRYSVFRRNFLGHIYKEPSSKSFRRYFMRKIPVTEEKAAKEEKAIKLNEEYNKKLCKDSSVAEWIEFVEFQDEFFVSQNVRYNTGKDRQTAIMKKKLYILEKGMHFNPGNEELLSYWMKIANEVLSADEMMESLDRMLKNAPANLSLWLSYVSVTQQSMSRCTYSSVTESYKKGINCLKSMKVDDIASRDSDILDLLFHYCKFLQDSGHWEYLWTIIKTNINLNFGISIDIDLGITDFRVKKLEDEVVCIESQAIWVTWRIVETLREGFHFLPVIESENYPQRCIPLNDLFDFVLHFHPDVHFKLIIKFLMLLKVPPLPFNTAIAKALFGTRLFWALDYPELVLSTAFNAPTFGVNTTYLKFAALLPLGPQYLRNLEGQQEFFEFIQKVFFEFMGVSNGKQKIFLGLWWLRFNRWICILENNCLAKLRIPTKKIKNFFKDFIKNPENRDNLLYYCEYSLFEFIQGNVEASIKTLKTLISLGQSVHQLTDNLKKAAFCQVHRTLCEQYIEIGQVEKARDVLILLALGPSPDTKADTLKLALNKYENDMSDLVQDILVTPNSLEEVLLPQFSLEWIHCYLWLLALSESAVRAKTLYLKLDVQLKEKGNFFSNYAREYLCEAAATIFWVMEKHNSLALAHVIKDGLIQYPENLKILSFVASKKLEDHGLWLTFKQSFLNPPTIFGCIVLISVALARLDTNERSLLNRLNYLFKQLATNEGKLSSTVHRLRLMFLFDCDQSQLEAAQIHAVASCPWSKSVYKSAITVLPSKLMELTDIMVEKDLRIHVTPDEIVEMRD